MSLDLFLVGLLQGLVLSIVSYGIMLSFRFLDFQDLTAEGAYPLGGAICASLLTYKFPSLYVTILSSIGAGLLGIATSQIYIRLKINSLLCGIIISAMAYSINLRIMGSPNIAIFQNNTFNNNNLSIFYLLIIVSVCVLAFSVFFRTDFGLRLRAVGLNPYFAKKQNINIEKYTILGLFVSCSLFGLAGSLMVQIQKYMDIGMGIGIAIQGLASLMIGEAITKNTTLTRKLLSPIIGAIVYQQVQCIALSIGLSPSDLKFFTGAIILFVIYTTIINKEKYL